MTSTNVTFEEAASLPDLTHFLNHFKLANGDTAPSSHTIIPGNHPSRRTICPHAAKYAIPPEFRGLLYEHVYNDVVATKQFCGLTERQFADNGVFAVDFDFRYDACVTTRQHDKTHIFDMVTVYLQFVKDFVSIPVDTKLEIFITEKPNVNTKSSDYTKDGIHMIIGLRMPNTLRLMIREEIMNHLPQAWELPLINNWDAVLDYGVCAGTVAWPVYGCGKPDCDDVYELTYVFEATRTNTEVGWTMQSRRADQFPVRHNMHKLSVQNDDYPLFDVHPQKQEAFRQRCEQSNTRRRQTELARAAASRMTLTAETDDQDLINIDPDQITVGLHQIINHDVLKQAVFVLLKKFEKEKLYELVLLHRCVERLPPKYYEPGSHLLNRRVAFALKHTDDRLFLTWVFLRSRADDFDFGTVPDLFDEWSHFASSNQQGFAVSKSSIFHMLQQEDEAAYCEIMNNSLQGLMDIAVESENPTEVDIANILHCKFQTVYVCVDYKRHSWYHYDHHRWVEDTAITIRAQISQFVYQLFFDWREKMLAEINESSTQGTARAINPAAPNNHDADVTQFSARIEHLRQAVKRTSRLMECCKKTIFKNNVLREAEEKFFDARFTYVLDSHRHLLGMTNGVVDFHEKVFRPGMPEDYLSKSTGHGFIPFEDLEIDGPHGAQVRDVHRFMETVFPIEELRNYMWDHLSSSLIGENKNQTFNIYFGNGSNGKSILVELMSLAMGQYKGTVPITMVVGERTKIGGTSDEVAQLKGVRFVAMQEPTKGMQMNEGVMKELTGGDPLQARGMYQKSEIFMPQFTLVVCANNLFRVNSMEDGTWRRICCVDFVSKFVDNIHDPAHAGIQYLFPKDKDLKNKLPAIACVFLSMLIRRAFQTNGIVNICETVRRASDRYRYGEDHVRRYIEERVTVTRAPGDIVEKTALINDFKQWYMDNVGPRIKVKSDELYEAVAKVIGMVVVPRKQYVGIRLEYRDDEGGADNNFDAFVMH